MEHKVEHQVNEDSRGWYENLFVRVSRPAGDPVDRGAHYNAYPAPVVVPSVRFGERKKGTAQEGA